MKHFKFTYRRSYGKGQRASTYVGDVSFAASDLADAYRYFGSWMRGQPYGRYQIQLLNWTEIQPPTELSENK